MIPERGASSLEDDRMMFLKHFKLDSNG